MDGRVKAILEGAAKKHGVPAERLTAMAHVESGGNPRARSKKGARGLLQLLPSTAAELGYSEADLDVPERNAEAGARYLRKMYDRFGDWDTAVEAYNAGPARVAHRKRVGRPLPRETRHHVRKVKAAEAARALAERRSE